MFTLSAPGKRSPKVALSGGSKVAKRTVFCGNDPARLKNSTSGKPITQYATREVARGGAGGGKEPKWVILKNC